MKDYAAACVHKTRRAAALLAGALALSLLAGCAGGESQPVVTDDDLTPNSAVQEVLGFDAGNGKTYAYDLVQDVLGFLSWEEVEQNVRESLEREIQWTRDCIVDAMNEGLPDWEGMQAYLDELQSEDMLKVRLEDSRKKWEDQQGLDPVVTPQEAANRAGRMFENAYGVDLTGKELQLTYTQIPWTDRMQWDVWTEYFDGGIYCGLDATTGEFIYSGYLVLTDEENERMQQSPEPHCYVDSKNTVFWDVDDPSYQQTVEKLMAAVQGEISGSPLVERAEVTDIEAELVRKNSVLCFRLTCDNGKTYILSRDVNGPGRTEYDFGGYPLRAYSFWELACWERSNRR